MQKLLSICIPTFNRAFYLHKCLQSITSQLNEDVASQIEIVVIDNSSTDNTEGTVSAFIKRGYTIEYIKNESNIGLDGNITKAFTVAKGKYVQVLGDDDYWISDKIASLLKLLSTSEVGIIYLNPISFKDDNSLPIVKGNSTNKYFYFKDSNDFLERLGIMTTFTSSNVVNKNLVYQDLNFDINRFLGTEVNLLNWIYTAALKANLNVVTKDYFIASKADNNYGYKFFTVFGRNFNLVLAYFATVGLEKRVIRRINYILTVIFFPKYLININSSHWSFSDNKEEIWNFLLKYRDNDYINKLFLQQTFKNGVKVDVISRLLKLLIISAAKLRILLRFSLLYLGGRFYLKVIK